MNELETAFRFMLKGPVNDMSTRKGFCYVLNAIANDLQLISSSTRDPANSNIVNYRLGQLHGKIDGFIKELMPDDKANMGTSELQPKAPKQEASRR